MKSITLTNSQFQKLKKFDPGRNIINTECELYILGSSKNKNQGKKLLKKFYNRSGDYLGTKLLNLNTLIDNHDILSTIEELVLPEELAILSGNVIGFTMPFIENSTNLENILRSSNYSLEEKINWLKKIGTLLEKLNSLQGFKYDIHLGDLHEANFIIDKEGNIKAVDIDSVYISNCFPFSSKYLVTNQNLNNFPHKYELNKNNLIIPSRNTDIYCYIIIILNTFANAKIHKINFPEFYSYMNYLEDLGTPKKFLLCIEKIYKGAENENPVYYLDELPIKNLYQANHLVYKQRTGIVLPEF